MRARNTSGWLASRLPASASVREAGRSAPLPTSPLVEFGYGELDSAGRYGGLRIDDSAISAHLYFSERQASARGVKSRRGIVVRHDEHYHVDFLPGCKPL